MSKLINEALNRSSALFEAFGKAGEPELPNRALDLTKDEDWNTVCAFLAEVNYYPDVLEYDALTFEDGDGHEVEIPGHLNYDAEYFGADDIQSFLEANDWFAVDPEHVLGSDLKKVFWDHEDDFYEFLLNKYEEEAAEKARESYDPDDYVDWDSMPGGHDDY